MPTPMSLAISTSSRLQDQASRSSASALEAPGRTLSTMAPSPSGRARQLIGRESQMEAVGSHLRDLERGAGGMLLLSGDPGIGRTRLAEEFVDRARDRPRRPPPAGRRPRRTGAQGGFGTDPPGHRPPRERTPSHGPPTPQRGANRHLLRLRTRDRHHLAHLTRHVALLHPLWRPLRRDTRSPRRPRPRPPLTAPSTSRPRSARTPIGFS